jgi:hypothetical protein
VTSEPNVKTFCALENQRGKSKVSQKSMMSTGRGGFSSKKKRKK